MAKTVLRGITWNHTRGLLPMLATAQLFGETRPDVEIAWQRRSLQEFADVPIDRLAETYDLLVIDHPWAGRARASGLLLPLGEHLPGDFLAEQRASQVGGSHDSYLFDGFQTALAIDAATPVASWRPDLLSAVPRTWDEVMALAREGRVIIPGTEVDLLMNFYMFCIGLGEMPFHENGSVVSRAVGRAALALLKDLAAACPPAMYSMNPIRIYQEMSRSSAHAYCPFAYGYSNYSRPGYCPHLLAFGDVPSLQGRPLRSVLGGAGLAISARTQHPRLAAEYAQMVADPTIQRTVYTLSGGQPGHRSAWTDAACNELSGGYFAATLPALDRSYIRPRYDGHLHFQDRGGAPIRAFLLNGGKPDEVLRVLDTLYAETLARPALSPS